MVKRKDMQEMIKLRRSGFIGTIVGLAVMLPAHADGPSDVTMRPYISESLDFTISEKHRNSDNGIGGSIGGGVAINRLLNIELSGTYSHYNHDNSDINSSPWKEYEAKVDSQFFFSRNPDFAPYFGVGLGYARDDLKRDGALPGGSDGAFMADAGFGAIHYFKILNTDFGVRADARYRYIDTQNSKFPPSRNVNTFGEPVLSVGLLIPLCFGCSAVASAPPAAYLPPPPPEKPAPVALNPDKRFDDIHFAFDKYNLTAYSQSSLDSDVATISKLSGSFPHLKVDVSGHTDWIGTDAYNQALSERRANAVKDYLVRKGVDAGRIRTYAYGESQPVAPNTTAEGRALNRRAEVSTKGE